MKPRTTTLSTLQMINLLILLVLAVLLLLSIGGVWRVPVSALTVLLLARLVVQLLRARSEVALRRPGAWVLDVVLLVLLVTQTPR